MAAESTLGVGGVPVRVALADLVAESVVTVFRNLAKQVGVGEHIARLVVERAQPDLLVVECPVNIGPRHRCLLKVVNAGLTPRYRDGEKIRRCCDALVPAGGSESTPAPCILSGRLAGLYGYNLPPIAR